MDKYTDFMNQIPPDVMQNVEKHFCDNVAVFKPKTFVTGVTMYSSDYHVIIPSVAPPDTYVSDRLKKFDTGKIIVINPGETIRVATTKPTKQYFNLVVKSEKLNGIAQEVGLSNNVRFSKLQNPFSIELIQAIKSFDKELSREDKTSLLLDCLATQIAVLLLREFKIDARRKSIFLPDNDACISLAIEYMEEFFSSDITINDICSEICVSPYHFIRTFKKKTGVSPHQFLVNVRIKKAKELLARGHYSVSETAELCGFVSLPHFSSTFKVATGYSPTEYKRLFFNYF